jgi:hypothetical protein
MQRESDGILMIDGFNWSALKLSAGEGQQLSASERDARKQAEKETFHLYQKEVGKWVEDHGGKVWHIRGDCTIASGFPNVNEAVAAAMAIQRRLSDFNRSQNQLPNPLIVRLGVSRGNLPDLPIEERGEASLPELDEVGHLQKDCPPGRIRISLDAFKALRVDRRAFRPALAVDLKSKSAESLVWVERSWTHHEEKSVSRLPPPQQRCFPLIAVSSGELLSGSSDHGFSTISDLLRDALVIIGETRTNIPEDTPVSHLAATSDAVGVIEVFAALQSSYNVLAAIDQWVDTQDLATQKNIVIVGSTVVNVYAYAVNTVTPAGFVHEESGLLRIRVPGPSGDCLFPKTVQHSSFDRHYGLVSITRSPINPKYHMLWVAGISGMATQAVARFVRDLVLNPTQALNAAGIPSSKDYSIAVVAPNWQRGWQADDYQGTWRVRDYRVVWFGPKDGDST